MDAMTKKYRPSVYNIPVDLEDGSGQTLLIHGYTGAMDIASEAIIECLQPGEEYTSGSFPLSEETFRALVSRGYLTERTEEEEYEYVKRFSRVFNNWEHTRLKSFTFMVTYNCNFRCPYCYESEISHKGRQWSGKVFTKEMVDRAYQAIEEIEPNKNNIYKIITLYGGEPLLAANKEIVNYIVNKGQEKGFRFYAVTNGYDLDSYLDLLGENKICSLQITIDGEKEFHDKRRVHYIYGKSYEQIMKNVSKALEKGIHLTIRANTDGHNIVSMQRLKAEFQARGFYNYKTFGFYAALLCGSKGGTITNIETKKSSNLIYLTHEEIVEKVKKEGFPFSVQDYGVYNKIYCALSKHSKISFNTIYCTAQTNGYILDPYGEIYPCWESIGKKDKILGRYINNEVIWNEKEITRWHTRYIGNLDKCQKCKYALFCGGGCFAKLSADERMEKICDGYPVVFQVFAAHAYKEYIKSCSLNNI